MCFGNLLCFDNLAGFDATGADHHFLYLVAFLCTHPLQIRIEPAFGDIVGVADVVTDHGFLSADFALF